MSTITHGQTIKRQRLIWRLLDRLDSLSFIARLKWLRALRVVLIGAAIGCFAESWLFYVLLILVTWLIVEIIMFRVALVEMIKELGR
jgi:hypothetical protein